MDKIKRAPSKKVKCDICKKMVHERGLINHIRLQHKLKITQVVTQVVSDSSKEVKKPINKGKLLKSSGKITQVVTQVKEPKIKVIKNTQVIEKITHYTEINNKKLESILKDIYMPSISKWKSGTLTEIELKEINRVAKILNKTADLYMSDLERSLETAPPEIRKQFE